MLLKRSSKSGELRLELDRHGFVLLVGEPAAGKTTIASMMAVAALDQWGCSTLKLDDPGKVIEHWNPEEPPQFFRVDDAFGVMQYESFLVHGWKPAMERMAFSAILMLAGLVYFWLPEAGVETVSWPNLFAILFLLTQQQIAAITRWIGAVLRLRLVGLEVFEITGCVDGMRPDKVGLGG